MKSADDKIKGKEINMVVIVLNIIMLFRVIIGAEGNRQSSLTRADCIEIRGKRVKLTDFVQQAFLGSTASLTARDYFSEYAYVPDREKKTSPLSHQLLQHM